ncbi:MAG: phospholipase [Actinomycetota bacterium]|nr:phospholipase [Actinomycetota bacterium]
MTNAPSNPHGTTADHIGAKPTDARSVVVLIHGRGGDGPSMIEMTHGIAANQSDVAWIAPTAANNTWYPDGFMAPWEKNEPWFGHTIDRFTSMLDKLNADGIPDERIVLLGFSQGACVVAEMLLRRPRPYGAGVIFTGGFAGPPGTVWEPTRTLSDVPVFLGTSDIDEWVPHERAHDTAAVLRACGADMDYRLYEGMGHIVNAEELDAAAALIAAVGA